MWFVLGLLILLIGLIIGFFLGCCANGLTIRDAIKAGILERKGKAYRVIPWDKEK